jgi:hypothetical protein
MRDITPRTTALSRFASISDCMEAFATNAVWCARRSEGGEKGRGGGKELEEEGGK